MHRKKTQDKENTGQRRPYTGPDLPGKIYLPVRQNGEKMKIVVLAAGTSTERAVSIVSGTGVCKALRNKGHQAILVDVFAGWQEADPQTAFSGEYDPDSAAAYMHSFDERITQMQKERRSFFGPKVLELCLAADMVFLALHGANGEDGRVQAAFDLLGIRYTGTDYISSAMAMNKSMTKRVFRACDVPTPVGLTIVRGETRTAAEMGLTFPVIVKPCCGGSSVGVAVAETEEELKEAMKTAFSYEETAVVEEFVSGREFSVAVIGGEAYPVIEIAPKEGYYDYQNKYTAGSTVETCPAELSREKTEEMQQLAVRGAEALGITGYCRLDFLMRETDGSLFCLEANTLPGMTPTSLIPQEAAVLGISYEDLCEKLVSISMKRYTEGKNA